MRNELTGCAARGPALDGMLPDRAHLAIVVLHIYYTSRLHHIEQGGISAARSPSSSTRRRSAVHACRQPLLLVSPLSRSLCDVIDRERKRRTPPQSHRMRRGFVNVAATHRGRVPRSIHNCGRLCRAHSPGSKAPEGVDPILHSAEMHPFPLVLDCDEDGTKQGHGRSRPEIRI